MITVSELRAIPLFAGVDDDALEQLARTVADIRVRTDEYAAHEGESRALIVVIEGKCDVTKVVEGVERTIGMRRPGEYFGEVPIVLNTPFVASLRATEPSRVIRIEPKAFHTLAASAPDVAATVGASALDRIDGLQDVAAEPLPPELLIVGPRWDAASHELRDFLHRNQVPYDEVAPDHPSAASIAASKTGPYPVVRLPDGSVVVTPSRRDVARAVGLSIAPNESSYDVVIIGGGPAGMAAAVYGASEGLRTILIERQVPGGQAGQSSRIENYLGFPVGLSGADLARRATAQAQRFGAELLTVQEVTAIDDRGPARLVQLAGHDQLGAKALIISTGVDYRRLDAPGIEELSGRGVYYGGSRSEGVSCRDEHVVVVGGANSAGQAAIYFAGYAQRVTILYRGPSLAKSMSQYLIDTIEATPNIDVRLHGEVAAAHGGDSLERITVRDTATGATDEVELAAMFVFIGARPQTDWLPAGVARDPRGFVLAGAEVLREDVRPRWRLDRDPYLLETSMPGVFVAGDVRSEAMERVDSAVGAGSMAVHVVHEYLAAVV